MYEQIQKIISREFSGNNAKDLIAGIANFHRIQSSPGYRDAAKFCYQKIGEYSIPQAKIHSYPAKGNNEFWGCPIPKEWSIESASLDLIEPKGQAQSLCRFFENPCSIIQRSKATPQEGIIAEVVILPKGLTEEEISKYDIKDKFVLTNDSNLDKIKHITILKNGAVGIIYDLVSEVRPIRTRMNFPSARRYTSFWYGIKGGEGDALGFVLSAQQGEDLRELIQKTEKENKENGTEDKVLLQAKIKSSFYDGKMEVVDFFIPGESEEQEVIALAHLCHPKPGAIDNASGCGTLIETARTLQELISSGKLKKPKRGIRFLLIAEFTGTYCYLASNKNKISSFVAGINLDMVGADQCVDGGRTLIMERTHNATPSFVNDLLSSILENTGKQISNFTDSGAFALFKYANDQPFSGGSDHAVMNHPDIGVGTPMFIQWPDRFYHTGEDTIDKVSAEMLHHIGSMTATYCYFIANADLPELIWLIKEVATKGKERISAYSRRITNELVAKLPLEKTQDINNEKEPQSNSQFEFLLYEFNEKLDDRMNFRRDLELEAIDSILKLSCEEKDKVALDELIMEMKRAIKIHVEKEITQTKLIVEEIGNSLDLKSKSKPKVDLDIDAKLIPIRTSKGPITILDFGDLDYAANQEHNKINQEHKGMHAVFSTALFWIDGKRNIEEISKLVECDIGKTDTQYLIKMLKFLEKNKDIKLIEKE
ncbi:MAG: DUF4910 domain-containing protein [Candidatus Thorarchaeota archaeon]